MMIATIEIKANAFQALWFFTLMAAALAVVIVIAVRFAGSGVRGLWRDGEYGAAAAVCGAITVTASLFILMAISALTGIVGPHP